MHIPYHHPDTIKFLKAVKKKYKPTRVVNLGDECFPGDAEVFTKSGWVQFKNLKHGEEVLQCTDDGKAEFIKPIRYIEKSYTGKIV